MGEEVGATEDELSLTRPGSTSTVQTYFQQASDERYETMETSLRNPNGGIYDIDAAVALHEVNGVSVAIVEGNRISQVHHYGFRDREDTRPVNDDTLFQAASMSKLVAALGIGDAAARGVLDLDRSMDDLAADHPRSILDKWVRRNFDSYEEWYTRDITLRRLLDHTAGLDTWSIGTESGCCDTEMKNIILGRWPYGEDNDGVRPESAPGVERLYSGGGYTVAEHVLELESGLSYADEVGLSVLDRLSMRSSTFELADASMTDLARGCSRGSCTTDDVEHTHVKAAGGLLTTAEDYAQIVRALVNDGRTPSGFQAIEPSTLSAILTPAHHIDSSMQACSVDGDCPDTRRVCIGTLWCIDVAANETCFQNTCRELLLLDGSSNLNGLGVKLAGDILADGFHDMVSHGGSQTGFKTLFKASRSQRVGIVILVAGNDWSDGSRGASALRRELRTAFDATYLQ